MKHQTSLSIPRALFKETDIKAIIEILTDIQTQALSAAGENSVSTEFEITRSDGGSFEGRSLQDFTDRIFMLKTAKLAYISIEATDCKVKIVLEASPEDVSVVDIECDNSEQFKLLYNRFKSMVSNLKSRPTSEVYRPFYVTLSLLSVITGSMIAWSFLTVDMFEKFGTVSSFYGTLLGIGIFVTVIPAIVGLRASGKFKIRYYNSFVLLGKAKTVKGLLKPVLMSAIPLVIWPLFILSVWLYHNY